MGQIDQFTGELNWIVSYYWNGCRTPFTLVIETAKPVAGEIALQLLMFGWEDIVKSFWRPKGLRSGRHGRKRRGGKKGGGIPSISDLIAETLDPENDLTDHLHKDGNRIWWQLENTLERINYTIMLVDMIETLTFKTILGILTLEATKCEVPGRGFIQGTNVDIINNGNFYALSVPKIIYVEDPVYADPFNLHASDANSYCIMCLVVVTNRGEFSGEVTCQVNVHAAVGDGSYVRDLGTIAPGETKSAIFSAIIKGPWDVAWYAKSTCDAVFTDVQIQAIPSMFNA